MRDREETLMAATFSLFNATKNLEEDKDHSDETMALFLVQSIWSILTGEDLRNGLHGQVQRLIKNHNLSEGESIKILANRLGQYADGIIEDEREAAQILGLER